MICTFYSYKGGVGRSMALAYAADILARAGLRVLMIDFDLEAPGLEQYFRVDHNKVRSNKGLFDVISSYKSAMTGSTTGQGKDQEFRKLHERYIVEIYPQTPSGGKLDLMPAGQREGDEQLSEYALNLRQFDWQEFYFNFGGEVFFEWLRRSLDRTLYDVVLVDSRTGVTEMGGICAYQLADVICVMCAPNQQNLEGTRAVVKNFFSPRVAMLRSGRPLELLVVPSRVEMRDEKLLGDFRSRFEEMFANDTPEQLKKTNRSYWDLLIPYDPHSAFQERVAIPGDGGSGDSIIAPAVRKIVEAMALLADGSEPIRKVAETSRLEPAEPKYDVTTRRARHDVLLVCSRPDSYAAGVIARFLKDSGLSVFFEAGTGPQQASSRPEFLDVSLIQGAVFIIVVGSPSDFPWRSEYLRRLMEDHHARANRFIPVLLPDATLPADDVIPSFLAGLRWLRLENLDSNIATLLSEIKNLDEDEIRGKVQKIDDVPPYKGMTSFTEADAPLFFGRDALTREIVDELAYNRFAVIAGPSGCGKTSLVQAAIIPALRRGAISDIGEWRVAVLRPATDPLSRVIEALASDVASDTAYKETAELLDYLDFLVERSREHFLLVLDQFEELFTLPASRSSLMDYMRLLHQIASKWKQRFAVLVVIRSEAVGQLATSPDWTALGEPRVTFVPPMTAEEMRSAIEGPAQLSGLAIEPGLTDLILNDAADAAGALPLLQYMLQALWERRRQGYLTVDAYRSLGGFTGSLASDAEALFQKLSPHDRAEAMAILLRLVYVAPDGTLRRRPASTDEFEGRPRILDDLIVARLVVTSSHEGDSFVELAHDAIIRGWPRLRDRIDGHREALLFRSRLQDATTRWIHADKQPTFLFPEGEILRSEKLYHLDLSRQEFEFLHESRQAIRRRRRLRLATVIATIASITVAAVAFYQSIEAEEQRVIAEGQYEIARREAAKADQQADSAELRRLRAVSISSPDGRQMLQVGLNGRVYVVDVASGKVRGALDDPAPVTLAAFTPDSSTLAIASPSGISIYDVASLKKRTALSTPEEVRRLEFSPDDKRLASASDRTVRIWSVGDGRLLNVKQFNSAIVGLAFSAERLVISTQNGVRYAADPTTGRIIGSPVEDKPK